MNIRQQLQALYWAQRRVDLDQALLDRMRARLESTGVNYDKPIVQGGESQSLGDGVINIIGLEERLKASIINRNALIRQVLAIIASVPDERYQYLLTLRYRDFQSWDEIGKKMGYSRPGLYKLHKRALKMAEIEYSKLTENSE